MGKPNFGPIFCCMLLMICIRHITGSDDCARTNYNPVNNRRDYYHTYNRYTTQNYEYCNFNCSGIDMSYITWIIPPSDCDLERLICTQCKFDKMTYKLTSYEHLKQLTIINSTLTNIPREMFNIYSLEELSVISSNVSSVEDNLFGSNEPINCNLSLNKIESINLKNSKIKALDLSFNLLRNGTFPVIIKKLNLTRNNLTLTEDTFKGLYKLALLDISNNNISTLPPHIFTDLMSLQSLKIAHNNLISLDYGSFSGLHSLNTLDVSYNHINSIPEYVFHDISTLSSLRMNHNNLSGIDSKMMIANMPNLTEISINDNPWDCDVLSLSIRMLKTQKVRLTPGNCKATPNIIQICCIKNEYYSITSSDDSQTTNDILTPIRNFYNKDFINTKFYNFFTKDYKQQDFWKYFDSGYKKDSLFRFFNEEFVNSQFYKYFNRNSFNTTFQNAMIEKISNMSQNDTSLNVTALTEALKDVFGEFFNTFKVTKETETFPKAEQFTHLPINDIWIAVTTTVTVLLILYIISEKCKAKKTALLNKMKLQHMFRSSSRSTVNESIEIV